MHKEEYDAIAKARERNMPASIAVSYDLKSKMHHTEQMMDDITTKNQKIFKVCILIHTYGDSNAQLDERVRRICSTVQQQTCRFDSILYEQRNAMNSMLPLGKKWLGLERTLETVSTAIYVPFTTQELFQPGGLYEGINARSKYDITYDDGIHGTIRGTDLIRQIDEENLTQPLIVSLTADQIMAMSLRGVTVHLPQHHIERLFISERYVQRNVEQGSCAISLYPGWQYSYVPIGSEKTRKSISGAELAQSLGGVVQVGTSESSLARRVTNVERRAGIANAHELGKLLGSMADNGLHSAADFDKQISAYQREEMKLRNEIAELRSKSKIYAATAHNLQACRTYKSVWLEYASKPLAQKDTFYKQNEAALQAYSRAASQLDKMGISLGTKPEKVRQLVTETESRIADLIAELEIVRKTNQTIQEDKEKIEQIQSG